MKKSVFLLTIILISLAAPGQGPMYQKSMQDILNSLENASEKQEMLDCASRFLQIAEARKTLWMPYYYSAYTLVFISYIETDGKLKDILLDRAQELIDKALVLAPDESELHVLQAFLYPSRIIVDPSERGMEYMEKIFEALEEAKSLNPENPRIYFLEGINMLNIPPSAGGGPEAAKPILEKAQNKFQAFENDDPLWPGWGEDSNLKELEKLR